MIKDGDVLCKEKKYVEACHKYLAVLKIAEPLDDFESLSFASYKLGKLAFHHFKEFKKARSYLLEF